MPGHKWSDQDLDIARTYLFYDEAPAAYRAERTYAAHRQKREDMGLSTARTRSPNIRAKPPVLQPQPGGFFSDKKQGDVTWRDYAQFATNAQKFKDRTSWSQDYGHVRFDVEEPIFVLVVSDTHLGSWGTDYQQLVSITEEILSIPNLYLLMLNDTEHMAIILRNVLEIGDNVLPTEWQIDMTESWIEELAPKIIAAGWDNHSVMREEKMTGRSAYKRLMSRRCIYHNGIGHLDVQVGTETYKIAMAHRFRGRSELNPIHAQMKYMRMQAQDREICVAGDSHVPGIAKYADGDKVRLALNAGTLQTNSGYAKRHFSLSTHPVMPGFTLDPHKHLFVPYWSIEEWLSAKAA